MDNMILANWRPCLIPYQPSCSHHIKDCVTVYISQDNTHTHAKRPSLNSEELLCERSFMSTWNISNLMQITSSVYVLMEITWSFLVIWGQWFDKTLIIRCHKVSKLWDWKFKFLFGMEWILGGGKLIFMDDIHLLIPTLWVQGSIYRLMSNSFRDVWGWGWGSRWRGFKSDDWHFKD